MSKNANLNVRVDGEVKKEAEQLFASFGITVSDAVNMFLYKSLMVGGLPFSLTQQRYNAKTEAAMREVEQKIKEGQGGTQSVDSLFKELDIDV